MALDTVRETAEQLARRVNTHSPALVARTYDVAGAPAVIVTTPSRHCYVVLDAEPSLLAALTLASVLS